MLSSHRIRIEEIVSPNQFQIQNHQKKVSFIRTPMLIGILERTKTNLMHFEWKVT